MNRLQAPSQRRTGQNNPEGESEEPDVLAEGDAPAFFRKAAEIQRRNIPICFSFCRNGAGPGAGHRRTSGAPPGSLRGKEPSSEARLAAAHAVQRPAYGGLPEHLSRLQIKAATEEQAEGPGKTWPESPSAQRL